MEILTADGLRTTWKWVWLWLRTLLLFLIPIVVIGLLFLIYIHILGPPPLQVPQTTVFYDAKGTIIGENEPSGQNRYWVKLDDISKGMVEATVAIEDRRFYEHNGFDVKRIAAAVVADIKAGAKVQGASTITQQYSRNLFLAPDKTWERKLKEAYYTARIEANYSKEDILLGYLNTIYYGHGNYGIEAASLYYFGKSADELTLAEASLLAGVPKGPSHYDPVDHFNNAKDRQKIVLDAMVDTNKITEQQAEKAYAEPLEIIGKSSLPKDEASYFQDQVEYILKHKVGLDPDEVKLGGYHVYTTLDSDMQEKAEQWVEKAIPNTTNIQAALVALDPRTGDVKALVGGRSYEESPYNRAIQAKRAPGSTFKPFLYYAALKSGFTPSTLLRSEKTTFRIGKDETYTPQNFGNLYANDDITMAQAIALSDNVYAVKTNLFVGPEKLVDVAHKLGIKSKLAPIPSLALGTKPVNVLEMVSAYGVFANGGKRNEPNFIEKIVDYKGDVIYERESKEKQVIEPNYAYVMTDLLKGVFDERLNDYSKVTGASVSHLISRPTAGKTGTTNYDSWVIGYTPHLVTGVWTGYDKGKQIHPFNDVLYSKNIWAHFMADALEDKPVSKFKKPDGVIGVSVDPDSGLLATEDCPVKRYSYYIAGTEPTEYCKTHLPNKVKENKGKHTANPKEKEDPGFFEGIWNWLTG